MKTTVLALFAAFGLAAGAIGAGTATVAAAQGGAPQPVLDDAWPTVAELAGTWVEPKTESDQDGIVIRGTESVIEIMADGQFRDGLVLTFDIWDDPQLDGSYTVNTSGRVSIAGGDITWSTERVEVVPIYPAGTSEAKRVAMQDLANRLAEGMLGAETYPMVSYDGREMVMNAGSYSQFEEYVMTRR